MAQFFPGKATAALGVATIVFAALLDKDARPS